MTVERCFPLAIMMLQINLIGCAKPGEVYRDLAWALELVLTRFDE